MEPNERRRKIIEIISHRRYDTMRNLACEFGVSWQTIYRDMQVLAEEYPLIMTRGNGGGVELPKGYYAMQRSGITDPKDMRLWIADSSFPEEVDAALDFRCDNIHELNELALAVEKFSIHDRKKLGAAVSMAKPENASQIRRLAENMDLFEFAPGAHTPAEYGKYMIQKSGHFEYDPNLDEFYDYERYGLQHMDYQSGVFTDRGYIAYVGTVDLEELMAEDPVNQHQREQGVQMGGMA